ncbi:MAG: translocation/assembly module TamB domain-containing protein, partial [Myxococcales bacterium]|nr:translocation/assembly module TamB domain-containing protein [Myxococcales bacterium]
LTVRWGPDGDLFDCTWRDADPLDLTFAGRGWTPQRLRPLQRFHPAAGFKVDVDMTAKGRLDDLAVDARLAGAIRDGVDERPVTARLTVTPRRQRFEATVGEGLVRVEAQVEAPLVALRRKGASPGEAKVVAELTAALPIRTVAPYLPAAIYDARGRLEGHFAVTGRLAEPEIQGSLRLVDAALTWVDMNARLTDLALDIDVADNAAQVRRLEAHGGAGALTGEGEARWVITPPGHDGPLWSGRHLEGHLDLRLANFPFVRPGLPLGVINAGVRVATEAAPGDKSLTVEVGAAHVALTDAEVPAARGIPRNRAVRYRDWAGALRVTDSVFAGAGRLAVGLTLKEGITVEGRSTRLQFGGGVQIERLDDLAQVQGAFTITDGRFDLFDNPFTIREGRFFTTGGDLAARAAQAENPLAGRATLHDVDAPLDAVALEPQLDVTAFGRVIDTDVTVRVVGPSRRPQLMLTSVPPLPEYKILTLLITGRVDAVDDRNGEVRRQAARLVDRFHNPSLSRQLYDRLGVDKLGLGFGASVSQPILTVGKQIDRRLYIETVYRHNAPPDENEKEARVEYRLSPKWTLDTTAGDAAQGSVGLFWTTAFGAPEAPPEPGG